MSWALAGRSRGLYQVPPVQRVSTFVQLTFLLCLFGFNNEIPHPRDNTRVIFQKFLPSCSPRFSKGRHILILTRHFGPGISIKTLKINVIIVFLHSSVVPGT